MSSQSDEIQVLRRLGLTSCQARIYLALLRLGQSTAKEVSKSSEVTRQDVYRIIPKLSALGMVRIEIGKPSKFEAISVEEVVAQLLKRREEETVELRAQTRALISTYEEKRSAMIFGGHESKFILIPKGKALEKIRRSAIEKAQKNIDIAVSFNSFLPGITDVSDAVVKALEREVEIRHITERHPGMSKFPKIVREVWEYPKYRLRFSATPIKSLVAIYDKKKVLLVISPELNQYRSQGLWSNNPSLVEMAKEYFEREWERSTEE